MKEDKNYLPACSTTCLLMLRLVGPRPPGAKVTSARKTIKQIKRFHLTGYPASRPMPDLTTRGRAVMTSLKCSVNNSVTKQDLKERLDNV